MKLLNADQEKFCEHFTSLDTELYGNGTLSYLEAYSNKKGNKGNKAKMPLSYKVAAANAYKLLKKTEIIEKINSLLEAKGFNNENVDKQHLFLLNQFADLKTKLGAVSEYNKLKRRIMPDGGNKTLIINITGETAKRYGITNLSTP